jgi:hypothetical protein
MYVLGVIIMYVYYDFALYQDGELSVLTRMRRRMRAEIK